MGAYDSVTIADVFPSEGWMAAATICGPNGGNCVEVNLGAVGVVGLAGFRDSKVAAGPVLVVAEEEWRAFLKTAKSGLFDHA